MYCCTFGTPFVHDVPPVANPITSKEKILRIWLQRKQGEGSVRATPNTIQYNTITNKLKKIEEAVEKNFG